MLTPTARILKAAKMVRVYKDGSSHGFVWRWWNPLVWVAAPLSIAFVVLMQGVPETIRYKHDVGIGMKPWFVEHPDRLEWLP